MSSRPPLKLGIIGCGRATRRLHLPALKRVEGIDIVALADVDAGALTTTADAFGVGVRYVEPRALIDDDAVEAVAVCVPAHLHEQIGIEVLEADKHVFIEKPLALDLDACDRLIEAATGRPVQAVVGFNLRHHRLVREVAGRLQAGEVGAVEAVRSTWTSAIRQHQTIPAWRDRRASGGGALFEIAVHHVDLWRFLFDAEVETVYAVGRTLDTEDETVALTATLSNGVVVSAVFSERTADENSLVIYGRTARITLSPYRFDGLELHRADQVPGGLRKRIGSLMTYARTLPKGLASSRIGGEFRLSYDREWEHFRDVVAGDAPPVTVLEDGKRAVQVVLAAMASIATGHVVQVSAAPRRPPS